MEKRKVYYFPKYLDDLPEVMLVPIDVFLVAVITAMSIYMLNPFLAVLTGIIVAWRYHSFKKGKPKNYFFLILYKLAFFKGEGIPSPVVKKFRE